MPPITPSIGLYSCILLNISEYRKYDNAAISVSANTTPSPDTNDDMRGRVSALCMHNTATGPTVRDAEIPTVAPSQISEIILQRNKLFFKVCVLKNVIFGTKIFYNGLSIDKGFARRAIRKVCRG